MSTITRIATPSEAETLSEELARLKAGERLKLLHERYGKRLVASTSFGLQAAVMLKLIADHAPEIPVVFIDTGYHFPETYRYADELTKLLGTDLRIYQPTHSAARMEALYGKLWEQGKEGLDKYGIFTKVEPMDRALKELGADVWISGVRRSHSSTRAERAFAEQQKKTLKVYPILDWADAQVSVFMHQHELPRHPLEEKGYISIGCEPCTRRLDPEMQEREARWFGMNKVECGLNTDLVAK